MIHLKMEDCSINKVYSGIYKITFPNNKIYIGRSNHIYRRMLEHNNEFRNNLPIERAILKYGRIKEFDIIEFIDPEDIKLSRERERYWIQFYGSNDKTKGYNVSAGGDGAGLGSENCQAKFTEEQIQEIYKELKENLHIKMEDIAKKYGVQLSTLSAINRGHTYYHSNITYPIRNNKDAKVVTKGFNNHNSYMTEELLEQIIDLLRNRPDMTMRDISEKCNVGPTIVRNINIGKSYNKAELTYPIRKDHKVGARKLTDAQVYQIIQEIKETPKKTLSSIAKKYNVKEKTISAINCGTIYKQEGETYPIR